MISSSFLFFLFCILYVVHVNNYLEIVLSRSTLGALPIKLWTTDERFTIYNRYSPMELHQNNSNEQFLTINDSVYGDKFLFEIPNFFFFLFFSYYERLDRIERWIYCSGWWRKRRERKREKKRKYFIHSMTFSDVVVYFSLHFLFLSSSLLLFLVIERRERRINKRNIIWTVRSLNKNINLQL